MPIRRPTFLALLTLLVAFASAATAPVNTTPRKTTIDGAEIYAVGFDKLANFPYTIVDTGTGATEEEIKVAMTRDQIPDWIRLYDSQRVVLTGYLMPLQLEKGLTKKFVIMKDVNTCCYGNVPNMNDYVIVTMKGAGITPVQDIPVDVVGTFRIEQKYEGGYLTQLFVLEGEKFLGAKK